MKRQSLLLTQAAPEGGSGPAIVPARESTKPQTTLATGGISDALEFLGDLPESLKDTVRKAEGQAAPAPTDEAKAPAELQARATAAKRTVAEQKTFESEEARRLEAGATTKPEFTADQSAWLELRAAATTPEAIAELEKEIPEFNEEQAEWLNAEADRQAAGGDDEGKADTAPEFTAEQKPFVDKLTTELESTKTQLAETESKRAELETALAEAGEVVPAVASNLHPLATVDKPEDIDHYETGLEEFIAWGRRNWDGTEAEPATGDKPAVRAYTATEIRAAVDAREKELRKVVPAAREILKVRQAQDASAQAVYPVTFDAAQPVGKSAAKLLKQFPVLKAMENSRLIIGDAFAGESLRQALYSDKISQDSAKTLLKLVPQLGALLPQLAGIAEGKIKSKAAASTNKFFRVPVKGPVKPGAGAPAARIAASSKPKGGPDVNKFLKAKTSGMSENEALAQVLGD